MKMEALEEMRERTKHLFEITDEDIALIESSARRNEIIAIAAFKKGQSSPKIKQLEWVEVYKSIFNADSSFKYAYEIHVNDDGSTILFDSSARKPKRFINLKDAKAAAQADFERRVMECLDL